MQTYDFVEKLFLSLFQSLTLVPVQTANTSQSLRIEGRKTRKVKNIFHFEISELRSFALWRCCFFFHLLLCPSFAFDEGGFRRSCHSGGGSRQKGSSERDFIFPPSECLHNVTADPCNSFVDRLKQLSVATKLIFLLFL